MLFVISGSSSVFSQERTISGTVTDNETGETLIGVNVTFANDRSQGTVTNLDGKYFLSVPETVNALYFSYVGYSSQKIQITESIINVQLIPGKELSEVVVMGYATQKTKEVTSAVASVKAEDFNDGNINNPIQLIQGKVSGLSIARPGSDPNKSFNIRIRGLSTFGANTEPLIIIDGIPGANLNSVDPEDIASMDILKDASAAAIYGTRAASGVILITTKKGGFRPGEKGFNVEFTSSFTTESVSKKLDVLSAENYLSLSNSTNYESETDWMDAITTRGATQAYNLAINGASENSDYRVSFNYRNSDGVVIGTGFEQLNARMRLTQRTFNDKLVFDLNFAATQRNEDYEDGKAFTFAARYNPTAPIYADDDFSQEWGGYFQREAFSFYNPFAIIDQNLNEGRKINIVGSIKATLEPIENLKITQKYAQDKHIFSQRRLCL